MKNFLFFFTYHADGFHGEEHCAEKQRYAFDGSDRHAVGKRRRLPEDVVEDDRETHHCQTVRDGRERRQEF